MYTRDKFHTLGDPGKPSEGDFEKFVKNIGKQKGTTLLLCEGHSILKKPGKGKHEHSQREPLTSAQDKSVVEQGLARLLGSRKEGPVPGLRNGQLSQLPQFLFY